MTTGRINQVTFHQRHSSAAQDRGLGHFRSSFLSPNAHSARGHCNLSYRAFSFLLSTLSTGFPDHSRQNPVLFQLTSSDCPLLPSRLSYAWAHGCTEPNPHTELSHPQHSWGSGLLGRSPVREQPKLLSLRKPMAMCWTLLNAVIGAATHFPLAVGGTHFIFPLRSRSFGVPTKRINNDISTGI
jgi:hypothetical protein